MVGYGLGGVLGVGIRGGGDRFVGVASGLHL